MSGRPGGSRDRDGRPLPSAGARSRPLIGPEPRSPALIGCRTWQVHQGPLVAYNLELFSLSDQLKGLTSTFYRYTSRWWRENHVCKVFWLNDQQPAAVFSLRAWFCVCCVQGSCHDPGPPLLARKTRSFPQFPRQSAEWWEARCDECWELKFPPVPHFIFVRYWL